MKNHALSVLLVDDDINICKTLTMSLKSMGCKVVQAHSVEEAASILTEGREAQQAKEKKFDLILTDYRLGEKTGADLIREARKFAPHSLIAVMTAFASIENAVEVTREGAFDYLPKPFSQAQLEHLLSKIRWVADLQAENASLKAIDQGRRYFSGFTSVASARLEEFVKKVAPTEATVLLSGESGTGKSELARVIHQRSSRASQPFVVVNCTSLAESLLESEVFGHVKGAFTGASQDKQGKFELAHRGTLLLDEIGDLSLAAQSKLLRFLQEKVIERVGSNQPITVDARVIAATNRNLEEDVASGRFREDLYYRINVFECSLVSVRFRKEDLPVFFRRFIEEFSLQAKLASPPELSSETLELLRGYSWPGNIREIRNVMERIVLLSSGKNIQPSDLPEKILRAKEMPPASPGRLVTLQELERGHIEKVLQSESNMERAAEILGINKVTLWRKRKEYGLQ